MLSKVRPPAPTGLRPPLAFFAVDGHVGNATWRLTFFLSLETARRNPKVRPCIPPFPRALSSALPFAPFSLGGARRHCARSPWNLFPLVFFPGFFGYFFEMMRPLSFSTSLRCDFLPRLTDHAESLYLVARSRCDASQF